MTSPPTSDVYISYATPDREKATDMAAALTAVGISAFLDVDDVVPGDEWAAVLGRAIEAAKVVLLLVSANTSDGHYMEDEVAHALEASRTGAKRLIPVFLDSFEAVPFGLRRFSGVRVEPGQWERAVEQTVQAVERALGIEKEREQKQHQAEKAKAEERKLRAVAISETATTFIEGTLESLRASADNQKAWATFWYVVGSTSLILGVVFAVWRALSADNGATSTYETVEFVALSVVALGLLVALAKYCMSLGNAYMTQSLRKSDRIHAISFGRFYLDAFGTDIERDEIREVFQHWNMDGVPAFMAKERVDFDPRLLRSIADVVKATRSAADTESGKKPK